MNRVGPNLRTGMRGMSLEDRFEASYEPELNSGCWLWSGSATGLRYGGIYAFGKSGQSAHRVSWILYRGPIPNGLVVCHRCDTPLCVNPNHLFLGTQADNVADMDAKGRRNNVRGEQTHTAKLTERDVREIWRLFGDGVPHRLIADRYGVTKSMIDKIRERVCWKHVVPDDHPAGQAPVAPAPLLEWRAA